MTTLSWPDRLPQPTVDGYGVETQDGILRTEMEAGPARQRRRYTQTPTRITCKWLLSAWQFAIFESWFVHKALAGGAWFDIDLLYGLGLAKHVARFAGGGGAPYKAKPMNSSQNPHWNVTATLEIRERPVISEEVLEVAETEDIPGLLVAIGSIHTAVTSTLPSPAGWMEDINLLLAEMNDTHTTIHSTLPGPDGWN
ncbi:MAG: hypothetical protein HQL72_02270 [Magnetococcales bacterium]|nr:hypothetical protein [Magnetococcales bacterium]